MTHAKDSSGLPCMYRPWLSCCSCATQIQRLEFAEFLEVLQLWPGVKLLCAPQPQKNAQTVKVMTRLTVVGLKDKKAVRMLHKQLGVVNRSDHPIRL